MAGTGKRSGRRSALMEKNMAIIGRASEQDNVVDQLADAFREAQEEEEKAEAEAKAQAKEEAEKQEKEEAGRQAKEEAERLAKEESERRGKEEAKRQAAMAAHARELEAIKAEQEQARAEAAERKRQRDEAAGLPAPDGGALAGNTKEGRREEIVRWATDGPLNRNLSVRMTKNMYAFLNHRGKEEGAFMSDLINDYIIDAIIEYMEDNEDIEINATLWEEESRTKTRRRQYGGPR